MKSVTPLCRDRVPLPPSCLEFVPNHPDYFVVGTYTLAEQQEENGSAPASTADEDQDEDDPATQNAIPQSRSGSLILYKLSPDAKSVTTIHTLGYPSAILDLHFSPHDNSYFSITSSTGSVSIFTIDWTQQSPAICLHSTLQTFSVDTVVTSGVWYPVHPRLLALTTTTGAVALIQLDETFMEHKIISEKLYCHKSRFCESEAWTAAFGATSSSDESDRYSSLYSGGDDSMLRSYIFESKDLSMTDGSLGPGGSKGISGHGAGVVAILPLPLKTGVGKEILLTGSYDEYIRVISMRNYHDTELAADRQDIRTELWLGGGVWRLKFLDGNQDSPPTEAPPQREWLVLASCMHAGAKVLKVKGSLAGEWTIELLAEFDEHQSMNYASDVQKREDGSWICVSTSFYDKLLAVWRFNQLSH